MVLLLMGVMLLVLFRQGMYVLLQVLHVLRSHVEMVQLTLQQNPVKMMMGLPPQLVMVVMLTARFSLVTYALLQDLLVVKLHVEMVFLMGLKSAKMEAVLQ